MLRWTKGKKERERSSKSWGQDHSRGTRGQRRLIQFSESIVEIKQDLKVKESQIIQNLR